MKKIVLICSHEYSGSTALYESLNDHIRIQGFRNKNRYESPLNFYYLTKNHHKLGNKSAIFLDEVVRNHQISTKSAYDYCKLIFVLREPEAVMGYMIGNEKRNPSFACRYYSFRLRRLYEMSKKSSGSLLLTYDDLASSRGIGLLEKYLGLKTSINFDPNLLIPFQRTFNLDAITPKEMNVLRDSYERYLYLMTQNLVRIN